MHDSTPDGDEVHTPRPQANGALLGNRGLEQGEWFFQVSRIAAGCKVCTTITASFKQALKQNFKQLSENLNSQAAWQNA